MRKRDPTLIFMDILSSLMEGPKVPTRLAQACNINYTRLEGFAQPLLEKGLIVKQRLDGQDAYAITKEGSSLYHDWLEIWRRLPLGTYLK